MKTIDNIFIQKLISDLSKENIHFSFDKDTTKEFNGNRPLENVVFY